MMKNFTNWNNILVLIFLGLFASCQTESEVETYSIRETITKTTPLSTYIQRVAMQATSQDNIVDKTSCFMINFPYGITVNNAQITINSASDYQLIQSNINAYSSDNDVVYIQYPVTVRLTDYSEKSITSQTAFNALLSQCLANSTNFGKINCLTIQYPITINVYNSSNQIATANGITNNQMLYNFFKNLEDDKFIAINYPVNITNSNGQNTSINSNSQFEDIIKNAVDSCPDNTTAPLDFMQIITSNSWKISYYFQNNVKTSIYDGYTFVFNSNYKVIATKSGLSYNGSWSTKVNNGVREFEVKFESDFLEKLDEDWKVFEFNNSKLCFSHKEDNSDTDYLYFEKN